ncbi:MAG: flagellar protein FliT [Methylococcaceae bacterium]|nr:MAG: flagellar protein FliT [Methylococcaceae bacterium]
MTAASATGTGMAALLRLTEDMLSLASQGAWDAVGEHEAERQAIIQRLPSVSVDTDAGDDYLSQLKQLLDQNSRIVELALSEKNRIAQELEEVRRYASTERLQEQE